MAFWGAPLANPDHARDAVARGAGDAATRCRRCAQAFAKRGWPELGIGVGINTGAMNVGDMGSRFRKAYTVLGDAVNLASRLEGLTKVYGVTILCGEDTRAAVPEFVWREIDRVRVQGPREAGHDLRAAGRRSRRRPRAARRAGTRRWRTTARAISPRRRGAFAGARRADVRRRTLYACSPRAARVYVAAPPPADWDGATNFDARSEQRRQQPRAQRFGSRRRLRSRCRCAC